MGQHRTERLQPIELQRVRQHLKGQHLQVHLKDQQHPNHIIGPQDPGRWDHLVLPAQVVLPVQIVHLAVEQAEAVVEDEINF